MNGNVKETIKRKERNLAQFLIWDLESVSLNNEASVFLSV